MKILSEAFGLKEGRFTLKTLLYLISPYVFKIHPCMFSNFLLLYFQNDGLNSLSGYEKVLTEIER